VNTIHDLDRSVRILDRAARDLRDILDQLSAPVGERLRRIAEGVETASNLVDTVVAFLDYEIREIS